MIARNYVLAILAAAALLAAGFTMGQQHANDNSSIRTVMRNFTHSVVPAPPNTTTEFSFINSIIPSKDNHSNKASTQEGRSSSMRSGFGNKN